MDVKPRFVLAVALIFGLGVFSGARPQAAGDCAGCARRAVMGKAEAGSTGILLSESLLSRLAEALTSPCFHLLRSDYMKWLDPSWPEGWRSVSLVQPPEYSFTGTYEENLNLRESDGSTVMSRLTVSLFYNGTEPELVETWSVSGPVNSYTSCSNRMFKNPDAIMRGVRPIDPLLRDFERRPASCAIQPEKKDLACGEETSLVLSGVLDDKRRESKPFNRIVVEAEKGGILNGESCESRPRAKAFLVGDGSLTVHYQAPKQAAGAEATDTISVFNSCDVARADLLPLARTRPDRKIGEGRVGLRCGVSPGTIVYRRTVAWDDAAGNRAGSVAYRGTLTEEATLQVKLKYENSSGDDDYYRLESGSAAYSFSYRNDVLVNGQKADPLSEKVDDSGTVGGDSLLVLLVVNRSSGTYTLDVTLGTPEKEALGRWRIAVATVPGLLKGSVDGRTVRGSYPAAASEPHRPLIGDNPGTAPGTTLAWNLTLPDKK